MQTPYLSLALVWSLLGIPACAQITARDDGSVGDSGVPPYGETEANGRVQQLATDAQNNLYTVSAWEEAHQELRKLDTSGKAVWGTSFVGGVCVATDGTAVFAARSPDDSGAKEKGDEIHRYRASDGKPWPFENGSKSNVITLNANKPNPRPMGQNLYSAEQRRQWESVCGLAVDKTRLWVSNYFKNEVEIFDKQTGAPLARFAVAKPLGIAVEVDANQSPTKRGAIWVANSGNRITRYVYDAEYSVTPNTEITGLLDPYSVVIGGPQSNLYATTLGDGKIRQWQTRGSAAPVPAGLKTFGGEHVPGPVKPNRFQWKFENGYHVAGLAVDELGRLHVTDLGNFRTQHFAPDGKYVRSISSELVVAPFADNFNGTTHRLLSNSLEYEVDLSGKSHSGWQGDGTWRLVANWRPSDGLYAGATIRRTFLVQGKPRDYLFVFAAGKIVINAVEEKGMRRSAMVGGVWRGSDELQPPVYTRFTCRDTNGNGKMDVPAFGEGEMTLDPGRPVDVTGYGGSEWVDEKGTIWFSTFLSASGYYGDIVKLPLQGFDERNNPIYDWTKREIVIPRDASETAFGANYLRIAANGEIWMLGNSKPNGANGVFAFGGNTVARFDAQGKQLAMFSVNKQAAGLMPDSEGRFFIAYSEGSGHWVEYRGADGKILATARPGEKSGPNPGWIDHTYGFFAFALNGVHYAYAEDVMYGKSIRYRFDNGP